MFVRRTTLAAATLLLVTTASLANAQVGDPFDAASLDKALAGMRVYKARNTEIVAMRVQYLNIQNRRSEVSSKGESEASAYNDKQSQFRDCLGGKLRGNDQAKAMKMQEKVMAMASNPTAMQKYSELSQAVGVAMQKGDTAAMNKAQTELMKLLGMDLKADSAAATAACGGAPKRPASVAETEQLERQADSLTIRLRRAETAADAEAARAAGVAPMRFAEMRERLTMYASKPASFQGKDVDLLAAHKAEIISLTRIQ